MTDKSTVEMLSELREFLNATDAKKKESSIVVSSGAIAAVIAIFVAIVGFSVGYVNASRVIDMQRELDTLKNRVDIAEAYITNLNNRKQ
jgi:hypothetical protein